jgi:hypothetical protein
MTIWEALKYLSQFYYIFNSSETVYIGKNKEYASQYISMFSVTSVQQQTIIS